MALSCDPRVGSGCKVGEILAAPVQPAACADNGRPIKQPITARFGNALYKRYKSGFDEIRVMVYSHEKLIAVVMVKKPMD
ncbi:MAG: hypothetical protein ACXV7J_07000 [Methylomonas sp.]